MIAQADATVTVPKHAAPLVLIVDDDAPTQTMLRIVVTTNELCTAEARSGAEALERAAAFDPDLVLLDLGLPDSDGIEVIRRLREWMAAPTASTSGGASCLRRNANSTSRRSSTNCSQSSCATEGAS